MSQGQARITWDPEDKPGPRHRFTNQKPFILNVTVPEGDIEDDRHVSHELDASDVEVPTEIQRALHLKGLCDYNTARTMTLAGLFELLTEGV
jgi:hypothetical protein